MKYYKREERGKCTKNIERTRVGAAMINTEHAR